MKRKQTLRLCRISFEMRLFLRFRACLEPSRDKSGVPEPCKVCSSLTPAKPINIAGQNSPNQSTSSDRYVIGWSISLVIKNRRIWIRVPSRDNHLLDKRSALEGRLCDCATLAKTRFFSPSIIRIDHTRTAAGSRINTFAFLILSNGAVAKALLHKPVPVS
jgi:hypothetical protein